MSSHLIYAGFTLTQFRHSYIQIPQWQPRAAGYLYLNWWTTEERPFSDELFFIRPPEQVF
jgi:hypothetical protein